MKSKTLRFPLLLLLAPLVAPGSLAAQFEEGLPCVEGVIATGTLDAYQMMGFRFHHREENPAEGPQRFVLQCVPGPVPLEIRFGDEVHSGGSVTFDELHFQYSPAARSEGSFPVQLVLIGEVAPVNEGNGSFVQVFHRLGDSFAVWEGLISYINPDYVHQVAPWEKGGG